jgi:phage terminase small subunit
MRLLRCLILLPNTSGKRMRVSSPKGMTAEKPTQYKQLPQKNRGLTRKQRLFIAEYQTDFNASKAAIRAGYKGRVGEIGYQLLQKTPIKEAIDRAMQERLRTIGVTSERVLTEIARIGFLDIRKLYRDDLTLRPPQEWDDEIAAAIAGIEVFEEFEGRGEERARVGVTKRVKGFDKVRALGILGKHLKLFDGSGSEAKASVVILKYTPIQKPSNSGMSEEE